MRITRRLSAALALLMLASAALCQANPPAPASVTVSIAWSVPDRLTAAGDVTITFDTETASGYSASVAGSHTLTFANNQTTNRRITIQAIGSPTAVALTANAASNVGAGATAVEVGSSPKNLITGIPGGTTDGSATVSFGAESSEPIDGQEITIKYTISAA